MATAAPDCRFATVVVSPTSAKLETATFGSWQDDRNGFDAGGDDEGARWNTYYRSSTDGGAAWSPEVELSAFVPGYGYKFAEPMDGYLEPYGDYFELDVDGQGTTHALWGEGPSYSGPGNVWYARI